MTTRTASADATCWFCGRPEPGPDGRPVMPAQGMYAAGHWDWEEGEWWCPPPSRGWQQCDNCGHGLPGHELVTYYGSFMCRECIDPARLVGGEYAKVECVCDSCVERAWRDVRGVRSSRPRQRSSRATSKPLSRPSTAATGDRPATANEARLSGLRDALFEGSASAESLAERFGVNVRTIRRDLAKLGATGTSEGRFVKWSLLPEDPGR